MRSRFDKEKQLYENTEDGVVFYTKTQEEALAVVYEMKGLVKKCQQDTNYISKTETSHC